MKAVSRNESETSSNNAVNNKEKVKMKKMNGAIRTKQSISKKDSEMSDKELDAHLAHTVDGIFKRYGVGKEDRHWLNYCISMRYEIQMSVK